MGNKIGYLQYKTNNLLAIKLRKTEMTEILRINKRKLLMGKFLVKINLMRFSNT